MSLHFKGLRLQGSLERSVLRLELEFGNRNSPKLCIYSVWILLLLLLLLTKSSRLCKLSALLAIVEVLFTDWPTYGGNGRSCCRFVFARWRQRRLSVRSSSPWWFLRAVLLGVMRNHGVRVSESSSSGVVRGGLPDVRVLVLRAAGPSARLVDGVAAVATHVAAKPRVDGVLLGCRVQQID